MFSSTVALKIRTLAPSAGRLQPRAAFAAAAAAKRALSSTASTATALADMKGRHFISIDELR